MRDPLKPIIRTLDLAFLADRMLATLIRVLLKNDFTLVARPLVRLIRRVRGDDPVADDQGPATNPAAPPGPFRLAFREQACDLLIFVPRSLESYLIDDVTGSYGYSHVAVDCGEVDEATGQRVFVEATPRAGVHRSYLDKYGSREFIRIPLAQAGVDCREFRACVLGKIGQPYDVAEVFTWGQVDDPAKQVCSDLAADCLPVKMRRAIVLQARAGLLGRRTVSIHGPAVLPQNIFVSPNGFARFFRAPPGHKIHQPDEWVAPRIRRGIGGPWLVLGLLMGVGLAAAILVGWKLIAPAAAGCAAGRPQPQSRVARLAACGSLPATPPSAARREWGNFGPRSLRIPLQL